jgi:hypothetical protein
MRTAAALITALFFATSALWADDDAKWVGYLRQHIHASAPISLDAGADFTYHLTMLADLPVSLQIADGCFQPDFVSVMTMANEADITKEVDAIGHNMGDMIIQSEDTVEVSGVGPAYASHGSWLPKWPERAGITLFKDEGYARRIRFLPGWTTAKELPRTLRNWLLINLSPPLRVRLPQHRPDALAPGKPIQFDAPESVGIPGTVPVPFKRSVGKPPAQAADARLKDHDLRINIELDKPPKVGQDVVATYLIGNHGLKSVWIRQNTLVPAFATWEVVKGDQVVATIDGTALKPLLPLMPDREAIPLNPGEYLTWRRPLLASALPPRPGKYRLRVHMADVPWFPAEPKADDQPQTTTLTYETALDLK